MNHWHIISFTLVYFSISLTLISKEDKTVSLMVKDKSLLFAVISNYIQS